MTVQELINILDEELNKIKSEDRPVFVQNIFTREFSNIEDITIDKQGDIILLID
jgi:hypothetical protein